MVKVQSEKEMQNQVCEYMRLAYPKVKFRSDKDGQVLHKSQLKAKALQSNARGFPDFIIREERKGYKGLVLELKREDKSPFKKDGTLKADQHLHDQQEWLDFFTDCGCKAQFAVGFDEAKLLIDSYLK